MQVAMELRVKVMFLSRKCAVVRRGYVLQLPCQQRVTALGWRRHADAHSAGVYPVGEHHSISMYVLQIEKERH